MGLLLQASCLLSSSELCQPEFSESYLQNSLCDSERRSGHAVYWGALKLNTYV